VRLASQSIAEIGREKMGLLIITHHDKLLEHNPPEFTHVMLGGRIVETGGVALANELHSDGYDRIRKTYPEAAELNRRWPKKKNCCRRRQVHAFKRALSNASETSVRDLRGRRFKRRHGHDPPLISMPLRWGDPVGEINKYDFRTEDHLVFKARKGLDAEIVSRSRR
jgi:ABC-type glutathione transport system ATPase component